MGPLTWQTKVDPYTSASPLTLCITSLMYPLPSQTYYTFPKFTWTYYWWNKWLMPMSISLSARTAHPCSLVITYLLMALGSMIITMPLLHLQKQMNQHTHWKPNHALHTSHLPHLLKHRKGICCHMCSWVCSNYTTTSDTRSQSREQQLTKLLDLWGPH